MSERTISTPAGAKYYGQPIGTVISTKPRKTKASTRKASTPMTDTKTRTVTEKKASAPALAPVPERKLNLVTELAGSPVEGIAKTYDSAAAKGHLEPQKHALGLQAVWNEAIDAAQQALDSERQNAIDDGTIAGNPEINTEYRMLARRLRSVRLVNGDA